MNSTNQVDHYVEAERLADRAEDWRDFDRYPLSSDERYHLAAVDAALAAVHAQLALVDIQRQIEADESREAAAEERVASTVTDTGRVQVLTGRTT